eukprot:TRINITY_DN4397_c0_g1_i2.p1 TRINITY_DN4397_c0_g1~~TRINITY_DN4397_c0_g1_i2.p1  ORF type:complete len:1451 (+),score=364.26 TRINITY_DN4397_c0_g1_i2:752-5104(+)
MMGRRTALSGPVVNCTFANNTALAPSTVSAGAFLAQSPSVFVNCSFVNNTVSALTTQYTGIAFGGAITGDKIDIIGCEFTANSLLIQNIGTGQGGAINSSPGPLFVTDSVFTLNVISDSPSQSSPVALFGGAIAVNGHLTMLRSQFVSNGVSLQSSGQAEGGAAIAMQHANITDCVFEGNFASAPATQTEAIALGGAISSGASVVVMNCNFTHNIVIGNSAAGGAAVQANNVMTLFNCVLDDNFAESPTSVVGALSATSVTMSGCTMRRNVAQTNSGTATGGAIGVMQSVHIVDSVFERNQAQSQLTLTGPSAPGSSAGGAIVCDGEGTLINCVFTHNTCSHGLSEGGAVIISGAAILLNCTFTSNHAHTTDSVANGGAVYFTANALVQNCTFAMNSAEAAKSASAEGGAIYASSVENELRIVDCAFMSNYARSGASEYIGNAKGGAICSRPVVVIRASEFVDNRGYSGTSGVGGGGAIFAHTSINVTETRFENNGIEAFVGTLTGGAVQCANITVLDCVFKKNYIVNFDTAVLPGGVASGAAIYASGYANISQSLFESSTIGCESAGTWCWGAALSAGHLSITQSTLFANEAVGLHLQSNNVGAAAMYADVLFAEDCVIAVNKAHAIGGGVVTGGAILAQDVELRNCTFFSNNATRDDTAEWASIATGGAIGSLWLLPNNKRTTRIAISSSTFDSNRADTDAGAIAVLDHCVATISRNTIFVDNIAFNQGGAIYVDGGYLLADESIQWDGNVAQLGGGGAVFWSGKRNAPQLQSVPSNVSNSAKYGDAMASPPVQIQAWISTGSGCDSRYQLNRVMLPTNVTAPSGCQLMMEFVLKDLYQNNVVLTAASGGTALVQVLSGKPDICLGGATSFDLASTGAATGVMSVSGTVSGNTTALVVARIMYESIPLQLPSVNMTIRISECGAGTGAPQHVSGSCAVVCQQCLQNTYNINGDSVCRSCSSMSNVACMGDCVVPAPGYWILYSPQNGLVQVEQCSSSRMCAFAPLNTSVCELGMAAWTCHSSADPARVASYCNAVSQCTPGREGFLCGRCSPGFGHWNSDCVDCSTPRPALLLIPFVLLWLQVVVLYVLLSKRASAATKILLNFVQIAFLIVGPSDPVGQAMSLLNLKPSVGAMCPFERDYYGSYITHLVTPLILLAMVFITFMVLWFVRRCKRMSPPSVARFLWRPLTALLLSGMYTPVTDTVLSMLNCRTVNNDPLLYVLHSAPDYLCYGPTYLSYFIISLILCVLVVTGVPVCLLVLLWRYKTRLGAVADKFGYVYETYRSRVIWWEAVALLRRTVLTAMSLIAPSAVATLSMACVCIVFVVVEMLVHPFRHANSPKTSVVIEQMDTDGTVTAVQTSQHVNAVSVLSWLMLVMVAMVTSYATQAESSAAMIAADVLAAAAAIALLVFALFEARATIRALWERLKQLRVRRTEKPINESTSLVGEF